MVFKQKVTFGHSEKFPYKDIFRCFWRQERFSSFCFLFLSLHNYFSVLVHDNICLKQVNSPEIKDGLHPLFLWIASESWVYNLAFYDVWVSKGSFQNTKTMAFNHQSLNTPASCFELSHRDSGKPADHTLLITLWLLSFAFHKIAAPLQFFTPALPIVVLVFLAVDFYSL